MVYNSFQLTFKYLHYLATASNGKGHGIHSPFIYRFIKEVLNDRSQYEAYGKVEKLRQKLLNDKLLVNVNDFGAGSSVNKNERRSISSIAKNSAKSKKYGQLLFRMVKFYQPATILELGTSLGITSSYLALANTAAKFLTIEGSKEIASVAKQNFESLKIHNADSLVGNFDQVLNGIVNGLPSIDFVFIDGNHRKEPVLKYFQQLSSKININSIIVFDDIHWSREMEVAWEEIRKLPSVLCSVDLFFAGIIFFNPAFREKQQFKIRF